MTLLLAALLQADLVRDLGHEDPAVREAATAKLVETGPAALEALRAAADSGDPEIALRARAIVAAIARNERLRVLAPPLKRVTLTVENSTVGEVARMLAERTGTPVEVADEADDVAVERFEVREATMMEAMAMLLNNDARLSLTADSEKLLVKRLKAGRLIRAATGPVYVQGEFHPGDTHLLMATFAVDPTHQSVSHVEAKVARVVGADGRTLAHPEDGELAGSSEAYVLDVGDREPRAVQLQLTIVHAVIGKRIRFTPADEPRSLETDGVKLTHMIRQPEDSTKVTVEAVVQPTTESPDTIRCVKALQTARLRQVEETLTATCVGASTDYRKPTTKLMTILASDGSEIRADQIGEIEFDLVTDSESVEYVVELSGP